MFLKILFLFFKVVNLCFFVIKNVITIFCKIFYNKINYGFWKNMIIKKINKTGNMVKLLKSIEVKLYSMPLVTLKKSRN